MIYRVRHLLICLYILQVFGNCTSCNKVCTEDKCYYCTQCATLSCTSCAVEQHHGHGLVLGEEMSENKIRAKKIIDDGCLMVNEQLEPIRLAVEDVLQSTFQVRRFYECLINQQA